MSTDTRLERVATPQELNEFEEKLAALAREAVDKTNRWFEWQKKQPIKRCQFHTLARDIDVQQSVVSSGPREDQFVTKWKLCRLCMENLELTNRWVPGNLEECRLDNYEPTTPKQAEAKKQVVAFCEQKHGFLILHGEAFGVGKSHLAVAIMRKALPSKARFITQSEFLTSLRATYRDDKAEDIVAKLKTVALLVLDDVGFSAGGKDELPTLHEILNHRYGRKLKTVLTTNLNAAQFKECLGPRMVDRLREATFAMVEVDGTSQRSNQRKEYRE